MEVVKLRTEQEINDVLQKIDREVQKHIGEEETPVQLFKELWFIRTSLLWVKGELENIN